MARSTFSTPTWIARSGTVISLIGIAVAAYLTYAHFTSPTVLACPETGIINCVKVTSSSYSLLFGMPVAVLGLLFFVVMLLLHLPAAWRSTSQPLQFIRLAMVVGGMGMVFWLLYAELFKLNAICLYCSATHILTFLLFGITVLGMALGKKQEIG